MRTWIWLFSALIGCSGSTKDGSGQDSVAPATDQDGDGFTTDDDCDDVDASIYPDAPERCNALDDDCDGLIDEDLAEATVYADADDDGFGDDGDPGTLGCDASTLGTAAVQGDCDDASAAINPDAIEICDALDNDCDGLTDDADSDVNGGTIFYEDRDGDGYGADDVTIAACALPTGYAVLGGDCADTDDDFHPGATEDDCTDPADYNCDGTTLYADEDGDGWPACEECDDRDGLVNPGAIETCDGTDDDCDGEVDEADASDADTWYADADGDGYGDPATALAGCTKPDGAVASADDCDDTDASAHPGAPETCNGADDNCDGVVDEATARDAATWYTDADDDGHGDPLLSTVACDAPTGTTASKDDCDDADPSIYPGATEICDDLDDDCDGDIDDADDSLDTSTATTWSYDYDGDGYGGDSDVVVSCDAPTARYVPTSGDCDDTDASAYPGATEACDGTDTNCDGDIDNDADGDGYADAACGGDDCDDTDDAVLPEPGSGCALGTSCADILSRHPDYPDGTYTIDVDGFGVGADPTGVACDMTTDGGGWTEIVAWDDETGADDVASLQALMTEEYNDMSIFGDKGTYIRWADNNATADAFSYRYDFDVPNGGEAHFIYHYYGYSMDDSATFFYVQSGSTPHNLACHDNVTSSAYLSAYSSTERSYLPDYSCTYTTYGETYTWDEDETYSFGENLDAFYIRGLMYDSLGDYGYLYRFDLWVR